MSIAEDISREVGVTFAIVLCINSAILVKCFSKNRRDFGPTRRKEAARMADRDELLKKIHEMPIDELRAIICEALDDSGIAYSEGGDGISLSDFLKIDPMLGNPCRDCIHNPPSSGDGKPCCVCDTNDPLLNCHQRRAEDG